MFLVEEVSTRMLYATRQGFLWYCKILSQYESPKDSKAPKWVRSVHNKWSFGRKKNCKLRYTCGVAFSRVTETMGLQDVIPNDYFQSLDGMNDWGPGDMQRPILTHRWWRSFWYYDVQCVYNMTSTVPHIDEYEYLYIWWQVYWGCCDDALVSFILQWGRWSCTKEQGENQ